MDGTLHELAPKLDVGDIVIDGGNSYYIDDIRRAKDLSAKGIHYVDVGTSGGVWGLERGYCQMIGGETDIVKHLDPIFKTLAPGRGTIDRTPGREKVGGTAEEGYLHCGPSGAGHFVKMVHNGIEYGLMAAYAEGLNILNHANVGKQHHEIDAETTPLRNPEHYSTISISPTSPKSGAAAASSPPGCSTSPPSRSPNSRTSTNFPAASPTPAKAAGPSWQASNRALPSPVLTAALYRALHVARRSRFREQAPFRDALPIRRPPRKEELSARQSFR